MKVYISPQLHQTSDNNGIGRVIHAQYKYLPAYGVELVGTPEEADIVAAHVNSDGLPRVDVLHCHGLYWTAEAGSYSTWHHDQNARIIETARQAESVSVPSNWVAECFKRDMRLTPVIIGHGIDWQEWEPTPDHKGYILWNKNRAHDVCDPAPAHLLADRGFDVVSTFAKPGRTISRHLRVTGTVPHATMKELIRNAEIYLATTKETFGIGTLEALAAGVPVLGYDWGGTSDLIQHQINGYLVKPGDIDGLAAGVEWIKSNRSTLSQMARISAKEYGWDKVAWDYVELYKLVLENRYSNKRGVSVVIACYNYAKFVGSAIESVLNQHQRPHELIVVNDGSTDDSLEVIKNTLSRLNTTGVDVQVIDQQNQGVAAARNNGIKVATQDYIVCLDADDMLAPEYIQTLHGMMINDRGLGVAYSGLMMLNEDGSRFGKSGFPPEFDWEHQATPHNPPHNCIPCAAMFRRDMWKRSGGYKQVYAPGEDAEFWTRGLSIGYRAKRVDNRPLFLYRLHDKGAHVTKKYKAIDTWHPWMRDHKYPMGAPTTKKAPLIRSYSEPAISVIIPVGPNHQRYLSAAIDSVLGQTFRLWELLVINDTGEELNLAPYPFIREFNTNSRHPGASRNIGIQQAKAPLIFFLDADDYIAPGTLESMLSRYLDTGDYIYSDWAALQGDSVSIQQSGEYKQDQIANLMPHAVTALVPTKWARDVGGFDESITGWEEWDFYAKMASKGYCGQRLPESLLYYRVDTGTVRKRSFANKDELIETIKSRHGRIEMGCCGGSSGAEIVALKRSLAQSMRAFAPEVNEYRIGEGATVVRMKFVGQQQGAQLWKSKIEPKNPDRQYRGANDGINNFANVHPDDVEYLISTGFWQIVNQPVAPVVNAEPAQILQPIQPTVETAKAPVQEFAGLHSQPVNRPAQVEAGGIPAIDPSELTGEIPPEVTKLIEPEPAKKRAGRPKQRGYIEDISEENSF